MSKRTLMTIVGTRPELIRLSETIKKADGHFSHCLVHTGQNHDYALNEIFYRDLGIRKPDCHLDVVGDDLGRTMGNIIAKSYALMRERAPDALLILGDTNSALCAISAKRLKIPVFHMEAGNRCFDENLPEEINRRIVDHISDINLPYTEHARRHLLAEGIRAEYIFVVGSPMAEVIAANRDKIDQSRIADELELTKGEYLLLSAHREENIDNERNFLSLMHAINALAGRHALPVVYSMHPRSAKRIAERGFEFHPLVRLLTPFAFTDYVNLQMHARCVVSDSGTLAEEAALLGFPAVSVRTSTERPEALEKGCFILGGIDEQSITQAVDMAVAMAARGCRGESVENYGSPAVSTKVIKLVQGHIDVVNKQIWKK